MKEEQAKKKWCPYSSQITALAAISISVIAHINKKEADDMAKDMNDGNQNKCLGSGCMMWRWEFADNGQHATLKSETNGFCGLAGNL